MKPGRPRGLVLHTQYRWKRKRCGSTNPILPLVTWPAAARRSPFVSTASLYPANAVRQDAASGNARHESRYVFSKTTKAASASTALRLSLAGRNRSTIRALRCSCIDISPARKRGKYRSNNSFQRRRRLSNVILRVPPYVAWNDASAAALARSFASNNAPSTSNRIAAGRAKGISD